MRALCLHGVKLVTDRRNGCNLCISSLDACRVIIDACCEYSHVTCKVNLKEEYAEWLDRAAVNTMELHFQCVHIIFRIVELFKKHL